MLRDSSNARERDETHDKQQQTSPNGPQPVIGIPIPVIHDAQGPRLLADALGPWAIERVLGRVLLIPLWPFPTHPHVYQSLWPLLQSMDGLLLPASIQGSHWRTHWHKREHHPDAQTWVLSWEIALAHLATFLGMPILSIADGAEKWNGALGASIPEPSVETLHVPPTTPETWDRHLIRIRSNSTLAGYLSPIIAAEGGKSPPWDVAVPPHHGIAHLADGLRPCAQSESVPIIAFERRDAAFGLGIIGRLDWGLEHAYTIALFDAFIQASKTFHQTRQQDETWEARRDSICATVSERVTQGQSLLPNPQRTPEASPPPQHALEPTDPPAIASRATTSIPQERLRQRSHPLTKAELNQRRRQRLKVASR